MFKPRLPLVDTAPGNPLLRFLSQEGPRHQRFTVPLRVQVRPAALVAALLGARC